MLDASVKAREDAAAFDTSRLVEFSERLLWEGPVLALSPLVREPGRLAITDSRVYFQPLHNISGVLSWLCAHSGMLRLSELLYLFGNLGSTCFSVWCWPYLTGQRVFMWGCLLQRRAHQLLLPDIYCVYHAPSSAHVCVMPARACR